MYAHILMHTFIMECQCWVNMRNHTCILYCVCIVTKLGSLWYHLDLTYEVFYSMHIFHNCIHLFSDVVICMMKKTSLLLMDSHAWMLVLYICLLGTTPFQIWSEVFMYLCIYITNGIMMPLLRKHAFECEVVVYCMYKFRTMW